ncbi:hypothetical protein JCM31826_12390 [Thermaurantimonas aggregans]|uniref:histidine kinase n=1 Tax=Thermaurantimonas aggregans TaxID=2173829 RepID=A0A401XL53_9FLAO|nr:PAS domain-containing sensor histidine kinase [Thermaurantimonas aggregans]MCX8148175.1 PAS domain-containing sensor histidine kinase [Thermaurantimonas aggregans]GCD77757.1 hypothetical protein JCM31826_12390 [Thermaurantimonas aggregans]
MKSKNFKYYEYSIRLVKDLKGNITDFLIEKWDKIQPEPLNILNMYIPPISYKMLESKYNFEKGFFEMFISNIDTTPEGIFYYNGNGIQENIYKIKYVGTGDVLNILLSVENQITVEEFQELNEIKYFYENIFHHSGDAIFIVEYKNGEFRYVTTNKKHRTETGIPIESIQNKTPYELVGHEIGKVLVDNYTKALNSNDVISYEEYLELPAGAKYWLTSLKKIVIPKSERVLIIGSARDITDLKSKEIKNQKLIEQLEEANSIKNKFFTIIAHDLKNPLYNSLSIGDLLYESAESLSMQELKDYLKLLNISLKNASELLSNLLVWSSSQMKGLSVEFEPIYLKKTVDKVLEGLELNINEKKINIIRDNLENTIVYCDNNSLYFILRNLISNAIKFSHMNGEIKITSKNLPNDEIQISIQDNGIGISEENKEKLFTFLTKSTLGTFGEKGSGLGLALVREFVEKNKGRIFFESELGKGTTFYVILPAFKPIKK